MTKIYRPESFSDVRGQGKIVKLITSRIQTGTFPQFSLLYGEEGLGKTTIAKLIAKSLNCSATPIIRPCGTCENCLTITDKVIRNNQDTDSIKTFKMSVEGNVDAVKAVLSSLSTTFSSTGCKVIILEECHRMSKEAQDALLTDTEYLPNNVYIISCTTDLSHLQKTFLSRAVLLNLKRLTVKECVQLLKEEASRRKLTILSEETTLQLISTWAECKPRMALKALEAMGTNVTVSLEDIKDFVNFLDIKEIIPIITSFSGSILIGVNKILEMPTDVNTLNSLLELIQDALRVSMKQKPLRLSNDDFVIMKEAVRDIDSNILVNFLYEVAKIDILTKQRLLASYLKCHPNLRKLEVRDDSVLSKEINEMSLRQPLGIEDKPSPAPSLQSLIRGGTVIE